MGETRWNESFRYLTVSSKESPSISKRRLMGENTFEYESGQKLGARRKHKRSWRRDRYAERRGKKEQ